MINFAKCFAKKNDLLITDTVFTIIHSEGNKFEIIVFVDENLSNISVLQSIFEEIEQEYDISMNGRLTNLVTNSYLEMIKDSYCTEPIKFSCSKIQLSNFKR